MELFNETPTTGTFEQLLLDWSSSESEESYPVEKQKSCLVCGKKQEIPWPTSKMICTPKPIGDSEPARKFAKWLENFLKKEEAEKEQQRQEDLKLDTAMLTEWLRQNIYKNQWTKATATMERILDLDPAKRRPSADQQKNKKRRRTTSS